MHPNMWYCKSCKEWAVELHCEYCDCDQNGVHSTMAEYDSDLVQSTDFGDLSDDDDLFDQTLANDPFDQFSDADDNKKEEPKQTVTFSTKKALIAESSGKS